MPQVTIDIDDLDCVSDGYHTINDLYEHRCMLFIYLCLTRSGSSFWKEDPNTDGWFLLYLQLPSGQISYHCPNHLLHLVRGKINSHDAEGAWDGHTSDDVIVRLEAAAKALDR